MTIHEPEQETLTPRVILVGIGPGDPQYVTARAAKEIAAADVVVGFATVLAVVEPLIAGQRLVLTYRNQEEQLAELAYMHAVGKRCVVCCYGDLNFSAQEFIARVERHCGQVERIPGISSVQMACARAALAMEETLFLTLHIRDGIEATQHEMISAALAGQRNLIILPLPWSIMPQQIATMFLQANIPGERRIIIYQKLTLAGESETCTTVQELATWPEEFSDLSIVVLPRSLDTLPVIHKNRQNS